MKINRRLSKKKTMAAIVSVLLGVGASGMAYAVKSAPVTGSKGGSFTYIEPGSAEYADTCPSPYEPLTIHFRNDTDAIDIWSGRAPANAVWVNIYYVPIDNRKYKGNYTGYAAPLNTKAFSREDRNVPTPTQQIWVSGNKSLDSSGPIIGTIYTELSFNTMVRGPFLSRGFYPARSWTRPTNGQLDSKYTPIEYVAGQSSNNTDSYINGSATLYDYTDPYKPMSNVHGSLGLFWGTDNVRVTTISNLHVDPNKNMPSYQNLYPGPQRMDLKGSEDSVTLPLRSFRHIRIEVLAGIATGALSNVFNVSEDAPAEVIAVWEAESVSATDGTKLKVIESAVKSRRQAIALELKPKEFSNGTASQGSVVNLLEADAIGITMKGTWRSKKAANEKEDDAYFKNSRLAIGPLFVNTSTDTEAPIKLNNLTGPQLVCN